MEWRDGKLHIGYEDQADVMRDLTAFAHDGESRAELRRAARDLDAQAADPTRTAPMTIRRVAVGGRAKIRSDSTLARLLRGGT